MFCDKYSFKQNDRIRDFTRLSIIAEMDSKLLTKKNSQKFSPIVNDCDHVERSARTTSRREP